MSKRKRRVLDPEALNYVLPEIIRELDLDICFRRRLAKTIESRITWALFLQESLQAASSTSTVSYRDVAIDTLSAIETPSEFLFAAEADPLDQTFPQQAQRPSRPPPRPKLPTRDPNTAFLYIKSADLEPPHDENNVQLYLLRCPTCFRTTFTSLQGLLNHARISHNQEWGSHDECVRACAVPDPNIETSDGIEVGLGPVGILPGLRSLFRRAVGVHSIHGPGVDSVKEHPECQLPQIPNPGSHLARTLGLHKDTPALAPFLGKHATRRGIKEWDADGVVDIDGFEDDNAQNTHDKNNDWERDPIKGPKSKRWRMPYMRRNDVEPTTINCCMDGGGDNPPSAVVCGDDQISSIIHAGPEKGSTGTASQEVGILNLVSTDATLASGVGWPTLGTRFHFVARIVITDHSLWIPIDRRQRAGNDSTHMWMISVDSPSYSHHITTILQRMTVTSLTNHSQFQALTKSNPPFAVIGMASEPFLAKVELGFSGALDANGQLTSQTMVLEHWVELDLVKFTTPAVGEEQVVDIELDKATVLIPARTDFTPIDSKRLWDLGATGNRGSNGTVDDGKSDPTEGYAEVLTSLLGRFPMTLKDTPRGRPPNPPLPYTLVSTPAQLKNLVPGRRKAIEWGRARALRDAYSQAIKDQQMTQEDAVPLTTADVFIWLSEQGHFLRRPAVTPKPTTEPIDTPVENKRWCSVCGQDADMHLMTDVKREDADPAVKAPTTTEVETKGDVRSGGTLARPFPDSCTIVPKELHVTQMPVIDIQALLEPRHNPHHNHHGLTASETPTAAQGIRRFRAAHLVAVCDPQLCLAVGRAVAPLKLSTFTPVDNPGSSASPQYPIDLMGSVKAAVETCLAPYAMLGLATQQFIHVLIEGGLGVAKGQKAIATGLAASRRRRKAGKEKDTPVSLLTPAHIMNGIVSRGQRRGAGHCEVGVAIFGCLARLRVPIDRDGRMANDILSEDAQETTVKTEQS